MEHIKMAQQEFIREFFIRRFNKTPEQDKEYFKEWINRFNTKEVIGYMDKQSKEVYEQLKYEYETSEEDRFRGKLAQFTGTLNHYKVYGVNVTDGIKFIMESGYSFFVTDFIWILKFNNKFKGEEFLSIKLRLLDNGRGLMEVSDGNDNILYKQKYGYTDRKVEVNLFFCNNVLMLNSEY